MRVYRKGWEMTTVVLIVSQRITILLCIPPNFWITFRTRETRVRLKLPM